MKTFVDLTDGDLAGFKLVWLDVDGTLAPDGESELSPVVMDKIRSLAGQKQVILTSNGRSRNELAILADRLGISFVAGYWKPDPRLAHLAGFGYRPGGIMIGDKFLTDGLWAALIGARFVKVKRLPAPTVRLMVKLVDWLDDTVSLIVEWWRLWRPGQWLKNLLIFAPLIFAGQIGESDKFWSVALAFVAFSLVAGSVYGFNDLADYQLDRLHRSKRFRPLPAGRLTKKQVLAGSVLALMAGLGLGFYNFGSAGWWLLGYAILANAYSFYLKTWPVTELAAIVAFYLIRIIWGGLAAAVPVSYWMLGAVLLLALLLIVGKRLAETTEVKPRAVLAFYSSRRLRQWSLVLLLMIFFYYLAYVAMIHPTAVAAWLSLGPVAGALWRFGRLLQNQSILLSAPERLLIDRWTTLSVLTWVVLMMTVLYT